MPAQQQGGGSAVTCGQHQPPGLLQVGIGQFGQRHRGDAGAQHFLQRPQGLDRLGAAHQDQPAGIQAQPGQAGAVGHALIQPRAAITQPDQRPGMIGQAPLCQRQGKAHRTAPIPVGLRHQFMHAEIQMLPGQGFI